MITIFTQNNLTMLSRITSSIEYLKMCIEFYSLYKESKINTVAKKWYNKVYFQDRDEIIKNDYVPWKSTTTKERFLWKNSIIAQHFPKRIDLRLDEFKTDFWIQIPTQN